MTQEHGVQQNARPVGFDDDFFGNRHLSVPVMGSDFVSLRRRKTLDLRFEVALFFEEETIPIRK